MNKQNNAPQTPHKNTTLTSGRPLALEVITFRPPTSVVASEQDYADCIASFEAMAAADGGRFESQLGSCELVYSRHPDSASLMIISDGQLPLGHARLVWSEYHVAEFRKFSTLFLPQLKGLEIKHTTRKIPALIVQMSSEFQNNAKPSEINLALNALVAAGFGLLKFLKQHPNYGPAKCSLKLPTTPLLAGVGSKKSRRKTNRQSRPKIQSAN